ncbi:MAG TPA: Gfo/Idh/MocA family oxidoreductase [Bryobacteraceae bacterium]|nr:Gfo/Idh/MocA family oxidoreductase [Bryobacteraceae bacterium]
MKPLVVAALSLAALPAFAQPYRVAVIGLIHSHEASYLPRMTKSEQIKLVGIAETIPELVQQAKERQGAKDVPFFDDYRKMLDETKPDFVWAFVENNRHLEILKQCAPRHIHVIYEKPLASSYKDALEMAQLARKYNVKVMCNYQMAWWPSNQIARAEIDKGTVGKPWRLRGIVGHGGPGSTGPGKYFFDWLTDPVKNGGGALMDFGCYNALWSLWYMGRPESVYAEAIHLRPETFPKVEDSATMVLKYKNGINIFEGSWDLPRSFQDLEIFGSTTGPDGNVKRGSIYMTQQKVELRNGSDTRELPLTPLAPEKADPISFMVDAIRNNKPIEGITALDINIGVVEIIDAAKESIRTGRAVKLQ